jgi:hypothetical protein
MNHSSQVKNWLDFISNSLKLVLALQTTSQRSS